MYTITSNTQVFCSITSKNGTLGNLRYSLDQLPAHHNFCKNCQSLHSYSANAPVKFRPSSVFKKLIRSQQKESRRRKQASPAFQLGQRGTLREKGREETEMSFPPLLDCFARAIFTVRPVVPMLLSFDFLRVIVYPLSLNQGCTMGGLGLWIWGVKNAKRWEAQGEILEVVRDG